MSKVITLFSADIDRYLDEHDKSELSRIIWKMEQLKAADTDPNQQSFEITDDILMYPESEVIK
ncbi:hypothetical protein [Paenibacillus graminis]|nr:hypothetical protein [Paenibacillus graminis]